MDSPSWVDMMLSARYPPYTAKIVTAVRKLSPSSLPKRPSGLLFLLFINDPEGWISVILNYCKKGSYCRLRDFGIQGAIYDISCIEGHKSHKNVLGSHLITRSFKLKIGR
ncbi:hypothetical protein AB1N83_002715 [Pleurotus pulmonarius]